MRGEKRQKLGRYMTAESLRARCGTGRTVVVAVPDVSTALEAGAWSYGISAEEYARLERRT